MLEACQNPLCKVDLSSEGKPKRDRRFCSDRCKIIGWALRRSAELLLPKGQEEAWNMLLGMNGANGHGTNNGHSRKVYSCKYPRFTIGNKIRFRNGWFETEDVRLQGIIESNEWFGVHIVQVHENQ